MKVLSNRVTTVLAKNGMSIETATALTVAEWATLISTGGNGIGKAMAAEIAELAMQVPVESGLKKYKSSKADRKAKDAIQVKSNDLEQLVTYFITDITPKEVISKIAARLKEVKQASLAEYILSKYLQLELADRQLILNKFITNIYHNTVDTSSREIILNKLLGELGGSLTEVAQHLTKDWAMKAALGKLIGGGVNKNKLLANVLVTVLIDVMQLMKLVDSRIVQNTTTNTNSRVLSLKTKELRLHPETDAVIVKYMLKTTRTVMEQYPMSYSEDGRLENGRRVYSGHSLKGAPTQSLATYTVLNKIQKGAYTIIPQMADKEHYIGKVVRGLAVKHYKHDAGREFKAFLDNYNGELLYPQVTITPDNGRMDFRGYPIGLGTGAMAWVMEQADKILLTAEEAAKLQARVDAFGTGKLRTKDEMEKYHYLCALEAYKEGKPTGVVVSNDFKGSGPLVQALMTKNIKGLLMSIEYDGKAPNDPYREILKDYATLVGLKGDVDALAKSFNEPIAEIREWVKKHTQPIQYGSGDATSQIGGLKVGSRLDQTTYKKAFSSALPHTNEVLSVLKAHAKMLSKVAASSKSSRTSHLKFTNAAGVNCCITPLSDGYVHSYRILGHNMNVPCKVIDTENHGVKTIAAGSHQGDSAILWTMYKLFEHQMYSVHDDFLVSIRHEDELQKVAIKVLEMFWNDKQFLGRYIKDVYSPIAEDFRSFGYDCPELPEFDWTKVTKVLF